jgi:predicted DNA repair protein MutK
MTVGVYGLVAGIVKLDDAGPLPQRSARAPPRGLWAAASCATAPWLMKALSVAGTAAMFLVGGGILVHGVPAFGHAVEDWAKATGGVFGTLGSMGVNAVVGLVAGAIVLAVVELVGKLRGKKG